MAIVLTLNGNSSGEGFLIAPIGGKTFSVPLGLRSSDGTNVDATLKVVAGGAGVALAKTHLTVTTHEQTIQIHATSASHSHNDTVLQVEVAGKVAASVKMTAITNPVIAFGGRFQARFATDNDFYNEPRGTSAGWNFALEGEPDFVPADNVATTIDKPVGRVVYFNDPPVPVRSHVAPIGVKVTSIQGTLGATTVHFTSGDPIIGLPVNLGPHTYLAANEPQNPSDPPAAETYNPGDEPMAIFEFHLGNAMTGKPKIATDRPFASGLFALTAQEIANFGIIPLATFDTNRKNVLLADYNALSPADRTGTAAGRNLATRIAHLGGDSQAGIPPQNGTLQFGYSGKEIYKGLVNDAISVHPGSSAVANYFSGFPSWVFECELFNYHSDEQCGRVSATLTVQPTPAALVRKPPTDSGPRLPR
jgi:hypothetical protein